MSAISSTVAAPQKPKSLFEPFLENGTHLSAFEFLRLYEASPEIKKAELVNGIVYIASPVRAIHGEPDSLIQTWLGTFAIATPGVKAAINTTIRLGPDDVPQPDGLLRVLPECGGQVRLDRDKYLDGSPELIVEVAASSASLDAREKFDSYRRARVREYLLWRVGDETVNWWALEEDEYRPLPVAADGAIHSRIFPGLWLATAALVAGDGPAVMARLHLGLQSPAHNDFVSELLRKLNLSK